MTLTRSTRTCGIFKSRQKMDVLAVQGRSDRHNATELWNHNASARSIPFHYKMM